MLYINSTFVIQVTILHFLKILKFIACWSYQILCNVVFYFYLCITYVLIMAQFILYDAFWNAYPFCIKIFRWQAEQWIPVTNIVLPALFNMQKGINLSFMHFCPIWRKSNFMRWKENITPVLKCIFHTYHNDFLNKIESIFLKILQIKNLLGQIEKDFYNEIITKVGLIKYFISVYS